MTRFERAFAPWFAALIGIAGYFLLIAWLECAGPMC